MSIAINSVPTTHLMQLADQLPNAILTQLLQILAVGSAAAVQSE
jgi:hypothetical protein